MPSTKTNGKPAIVEQINARELFNHHKATLKKHFGYVEKVDEIELARFCHLISEIQRLRKEVSGVEVIHTSHTSKPNPRLTVIKEYEFTAAVISKRLGLFLAEREAAKGKAGRNAGNKPNKDDEPDLDDILGASDEGDEIER